ncbi:MAG: hypothetical protein AAF663_02640 [Planctomycetota bacterium]
MWLPKLHAELSEDEFRSPTHRYDRELVLAYLRLHKQIDLDEANQFLASFTLDDQPREWAHGEIDTADWNFSGIKLLRILKDFEDDPALRPPARGRLVEILRDFPQPRVRHNRDNDRRAVWPGIHTENHDLILLTLGYFRAQLRGEDLSAHEQHLARSLSWRMRMGWLEANSPVYQTRYVEPLAVLIDHAPNPAIRAGAENVLNHLLAERAMFSVQGYLAGPQARTRTGPEEPSRDRMLPLLHVWMDALLPADQSVEPYYDAYWLARSGFTPASVIQALRRERTAPLAEPRFYRGMRTRRGGEHTEFRYFLSPHLAIGSMDWRGSTRRHRYHNLLLAHPRGEPEAVWFFHAPEDTPSDPRFGFNESVQWGDALVARGEPGFTDGIEEADLLGWRVIHTPWAAVAIAELPDGWKLAVGLDLKREGLELADAVAELNLPKASAKGDILWTDRSGIPIRFDLRPSGVAHDVYIHKHKQLRIDGMLHNVPELNSWYGTGIVDVSPASHPPLRFTTEPLDQLLLKASLGQEAVEIKE